MTTDAASTRELPIPVPGSVIVALLTTFVAACFGFGISLFAQLVPDMRADLHFDYALVGTVTAAVQFAFLLFAVLAAWLSPRLGAAQVVVAATTLCGICLLIVPFTRSVAIVAVLLAVMGGTAAAVFVPTIEIVRRVVAPRQRGFAMSLISSGTAYGVVINSLLVPIFVRDGNWRAVWYIEGCATLAVVVLAVLVFKRAALFHRTDDRADPAQAQAKTQIQTQAPGGIRSAMPWVLLIWSLSFLNGVSTYPFQNFLSPYLREELGFTVAHAAWVWGTIGVVGMGAGLAVGGLSTRLGLRPAILFCYLSFLASGAILVLAPTRALSICAGILFSLGFYPIFGLLPAYVSHRTNAMTAVAIFGICNVAQGLGGTVGNAAAGGIKTFTHSFSGIYLAFAVSAIVCAALSISLPRSLE